MDALDVISLAQAKENLVVDFDDRDDEIKRLIRTAVASIEKYTNVMLYQRGKTYQALGSCIEIYDYPIAFSDNTLKLKSNVLSVTVYGLSNPYPLISANVGFTVIPDDYLPLIEACNKLITYWYENKDAYSVTLPFDIQCMVNQFRRSATI